ncbi:MAG: zinc metallopeptidase [Candidatus Margulisiibacteriota bacterium]
MFYYDYTFLMLLPALVFAFYAKFKVSSTFEKYSLVRPSSGISGNLLARNLLDGNGLGDIKIRPSQGSLTDNYDPMDKTINLSEDVYSGSSIAAMGVIAHEVSHAVQDKDAYFPMKIRSSIVPISSFGSNLSIPLFFAGLIFQYGPLMDAGIILFSLAVAFTVITLPVEFNASKRAVAMLSSSGYLSSQEIGLAKKVLDAAALTYVAATAMALFQLLRLVALRERR